MSGNLGIVIRREYMERVSKKSFILTTIFVPLLMVGFMIFPALLMALHESDTYRYAVVDNSGVISDKLTDTEAVVFVASSEPVDSLKKNMDTDGIIMIGSDILQNPSAVQLYSYGPGSLDVEREITRQIKDAIESERLKAYDISNLKEIMAEVEANTSMTTYRLDQGQESSSMSSTMCFVIGLAVAFMLYMFLMIYGQMVMTSIIEEKNNRVLEIIVSSVRPEQLMLGKILGIGLVAITQIVIWIIIICAMVGLVIPSVMPADLAGDVSAFGAGNLDVANSSNNIAMIQAMSVIGDLGYLLKIFFYLTIFLIGGFLLYASIYAAIGSAVDNIQDASQLTSVAVVPIMVGLVCATTIGSDPNTTLAMWLSMIPFTSPMIMMVRIPFGIPAWEIWLSIVILYLSFLVMVWFAAKIYRVGIFMYGKKPSIKELIRWARYK